MSPSLAFALGGLAGAVGTVVFAWFIATVWDLPRDGVDLGDAPELSAAEVVAAHTGNVRVVRPHSFDDCDCHDAWDQCPCVEAGHGKGCACCGYGICGPLAADAS